MEDHNMDLLNKTKLMDLESLNGLTEINTKVNCFLVKYLAKELIVIKIYNMMDIFKIMKMMKLAYLQVIIQKTFNKKFKKQILYNIPKI